MGNLYYLIMNRLNYRSLRGGNKTPKKKKVVNLEDSDDDNKNNDENEDAMLIIDNLTAKSQEKRIKAIYKIKRMTKTYSLPDEIVKNYLETIFGDLINVFIFLLLKINFCANNLFTFLFLLILFFFYSIFF